MAHSNRRSYLIPAGLSSRFRGWLRSKSLLSIAQSRQHGEILERSRIALDFRPRGNLFKQATHDFARARFRQGFGETYVIRLGDRADFFGDMLAQFLAQAAVAGDSGF